jgi:hypothetical protein
MTADLTARPAEPLSHATGSSPLRGLVGLTSAELRRWFPGRAIIFAAIGVGLAFIVFAIWSGGAAADDPRLGTFTYPLFGLWIVILILVMVATAQGAMANEVEDGTAAWVVAKPVGRAAFVISKFLAALPGVLIGAVAVPGIVIRPLMRAAEAKGDTEFSAGQVFELLQTRCCPRDEYTTLPPLGRYLGVLTLITVILLLIVAVMILLGCAVRSRAALFLAGLAVPIGLLVYALVGPAAIVELTPAWAYDSLLEAIVDDPAPVFAPALVTVGWTIGVMALAVAWFSRKEL